MQAVILLQVAGERQLAERLSHQMSRIQADGGTVLDVQVLVDVDRRGYLAVIRYDDPSVEGPPCPSTEP